MLSAFYTKKKLGEGTEEIPGIIMNLSQEFYPKEAVKMMKEISKERKFKESVEAIIRLSVDPK